MGWDLLEQGEFDGALEVAETLLAEAPSDPEAGFLSATALFESGDLPEAERRLRALLEREPGDDEARLTLASVLYHACRFEEADRMLEEASPEADRNPFTHHLRGLLHDARGRHAEADASFARATRLDPERFPPACTLTRRQFDAVVEEALAGLPDEFRARVGNLPILVEEVPTPGLLATLEEPAPDLLGLFVGTPLTEKSSVDLPVEPDRVYLFKRNLERHCEDREDLKEEIRVTLLHEIGHFLGMDEEDLDEAGYA